MRIDPTLPSLVSGMSLTPGQSGSASFAALVLAPADTDAEKDAKANLPRTALSFDAPGLLGVGGPASAGAPTAVPEDVTTQRPPHDQIIGSHTQAAFVSKTTAILWTVSVPPAHAAGPSIAFAEAASMAPAANTAATAPTAAPSAPAALSRASGAIWPAASSLGLQGTPSRLTLEDAPVSETVQSTSSAGRASFPGGVVVGNAQTEPTEEAASPRKAQALKLQADTDTASGQISVVLSETEDGLSVTATAPDLSDRDKLALKRAVDDAASDAGLALGNFRLNGVAIRSLSKIS